MANQFVYGLILGLSLGPACIFSCGAVLGSAVAGEAGRGGRAHLALGKFLAGRLLGYAAVGAAAGALAGAGARLLEPEAVRLAGAATALVLGLALAALGISDWGLMNTGLQPQMYTDKHGWNDDQQPATSNQQPVVAISVHLCPSVAKKEVSALACTPRLAAVPLLLGLLAGLSPCPQFVLAVVRAMLGGLSTPLGAASEPNGESCGSWLAGLACFLGLYLGSSVYLLPATLIRARSQAGRERILRLGAGAAILAGTLYASAGLRGLSPAARAGAERGPVLTEEQARRALPEAERLERRSQTVFAGWRGREPAGCAALGRAPGYGGPVSAVVGTSAEGVVERVELLPGAETPLHLGRLADARFLERFRGKRFDAPFELGRDVDAVSGATATAAAVCAAVRGAVRPLGERAGPAGAARFALAMPRPMALSAIAFVVLVAAFARRLGGRLRLACLAVSLVVLGILTGQYFSVADLTRLRADLLPAGPEATGLLLFLAVLVGATLWRGRVWCTHLCPFGALAELAGRLTGARSGLPRALAGFARVLPWLMLAGITAAVAWTGRTEAALAEPFATTFAVLSGRSSPAAAWREAAAGTVLAGLVLLVSLFSARFYCRCLCGAGALLGLVARCGAAGPAGPTAPADPFAPQAERPDDAR